MKKLILDPEDKQILADYDSGAFVSVANQSDEIRKMRTYAKNSLEKSITINLRIQPETILRIKAKALGLGIPYQTLIASVIYQYSKTDSKSEPLGL